MSRTEIICSGTSFGNGIATRALSSVRLTVARTFSMKNVGLTNRLAAFEQKLLTRRLLSKWGTPPWRSAPPTEEYTSNGRLASAAARRSPLGSAEAVKGCHGERRRSATKYRAHRRD
jgi:hypothetical protein